MTKQEQINQLFSEMKEEFVVNNHKTTRDITSAFNNELKHFNDLLMEFNKEYVCISNTDLITINERFKEILNSTKIMLIGSDYDARFDKNLHLLLTTMHDFFLKKIDNRELRIPSKNLNRYLNEMCRFDFFIMEDKLENDFGDFIDEFVYRYINSDDAKRDFADHLMKNVKHSLICNLKKIIATSIENKQDIVARYNTDSKEIIASSEQKR